MSKPTTESNRRAYELREQGLGWPEIGAKLGIDPETARSRARRYRAGPGAVKTETIEKQASRKQVLEETAKDHGFDSAAELKAVLSSLKGKPATRKKIKRSTAKTRSVKLLVLTDTHIGHNKFNYDLWDRVVTASKDADIILHPGDHLEGMSGRPGHVYELERVGFSEQIRLCKDLYRELAPKPMYGVDGNHDGWYYKKADIGLIVGEHLDNDLENFTNLGQCEGDLHIDGLWIKLFHPNDGTSYATSYKGQKLVESFTGGEKPHIVFEGHYHKALYQFVRNVHQFECGTICGQSEFMRLKKLPAHMGFWEVVVRWTDSGVTKIEQAFTPGYE